MKFISRWMPLLAGLLLLAACAPAPLTASVTETPLATPTAQAQEAGTPTEGFILLFTPAPSETPLPPLELPTVEANPPALRLWDGLPTYPGDSQPGFFFRLRYDPEVWALTEGDFGEQVLGHRAIPYCVISPASGRGLPLNVVVEHEQRTIGAILYEVSTAYQAGQKQFVTYLGGDSNIYTGLQVAFQDESETCLSDAEVVLATLQSVPAAQATPQP